MNYASVEIAGMKAELEAEGYYNFPDLSETQWTAPSHYDDTLVNIDCVHCENPDVAILEAYAHLQERKELQALRAFVLRAKHDLAYSDNLQAEASDLVDQYNITADESEADE